MLSIGKVGGRDGDPRYYTQTVARGQEDYYTGDGEAPGRWAGKGAATRDLQGHVDADEFLAALTPPADSERHLLGYDLTFSAPKSVSVLYALGSPGVAAAVVAAHDQAVLQAIGYLEQHAAWTRRGHGGALLVQADALTVATFRHRTSRAGDPQLHTHSVIVNEVTAHGRATALDGRALYAHGRTTGFLYQAALRDQLTRRLGVTWTPVHNGVAEIRGIDEPLRQAFSQRSQQIREHLGLHGGRGARAAQISALETRRAKPPTAPAVALREQWYARARTHGVEPDDLTRVIDRGPRTPAMPAPAEGAAMLAAPHGLTRTLSTFDRRDVLRAWAELHRDGARIDQLTALADQWLDDEECIRLDNGRHRPHLGGARYTTRDMLRIEQQLIDSATERRATGIALADPDTVEQVIATRPTLADEQADLVRQLTTSGDGVQIIRAAAGTGKTFALAAARDAWEHTRTPVFGTALAARAVVELETMAGIDACTVAQLQQDIAHGHGLRPGSVLIVDEAAMVGTRSLHALAQHAADTQSKLVLVGDDHQLPELEAGGGFRALAGRLDAIELHHVRRQTQHWDRAALATLRDGRITDWATTYRDHGRLIAQPTAQDARSALVDDWWETARLGNTDTVMIAHRRADVGALNDLARARMHRDGRLGDEELAAGGRHFAIGDRVLTRRNDRQLGVINGTRADVVALDTEHHILTIRTDPDTELTIDSRYLDEGHLDHGYAITAHAAQGATVDRAYVLGSDDLYREWGYTALTRHRTEARFYIVSTGAAERALPGLEPDPDQLTQDAVSILHTTRHKHTATELAERTMASTPQLEGARAAAQSFAPMVDQTAYRDRTDGWSCDAPCLLQAPELHDARVTIADPPEALVLRIGTRPTPLGERDRWCQAAARLAGRDDLATIRPDFEAAADELLLER